MEAAARPEVVSLPAAELLDSLAHLRSASGRHSSCASGPTGPTTRSRPAWAAARPPCARSSIVGWAPFGRRSNDEHAFRRRDRRPAASLAGRAQRRHPRPAPPLDDRRDYTAEVAPLTRRRRWAPAVVAVAGLAAAVALAVVLVTRDGDEAPLTTEPAATAPPLPSTSSATPACRLPRVRCPWSPWTFRGHGRPDGDHGAATPWPGHLARLRHWRRGAGAGAGRADHRVRVRSAVPRGGLHDGPRRRADRSGLGPAPRARRAGEPRTGR